MLKVSSLITARKASSKGARFEKLVGIFSVDAKHDSVSTQLTRIGLITVYDAILTSRQTRLK